MWAGCGGGGGEAGAGKTTRVPGHVSHNDVSQSKVVTRTRVSQVKLFRQGNVNDRRNQSHSTMSRAVNRRTRGFALTRRCADKYQE